MPEREEVEIAFITTADTQGLDRARSDLEQLQSEQLRQQTPPQRPQVLDPRIEQQRQYNRLLTDEIRLRENILRQVQQQRSLENQQRARSDPNAGTSGAFSRGLASSGLLDTKRMEDAIGRLEAAFNISIARGGLSTIGAYNITRQVAQGLFQAPTPILSSVIRSQIPTFIRNAPDLGPAATGGVVVGRFQHPGTSPGGPFITIAGGASDITGTTTHEAAHAFDWSPLTEALEQGLTGAFRPFSERGFLGDRLEPLVHAVALRGPIANQQTAAQFGTQPNLNLLPTEYAGTNRREAFAEIIREATRNNAIPQGIAPPRILQAVAGLLGQGAEPGFKREFAERHELDRPELFPGLVGRILREQQEPFSAGMDSAVAALKQIRMQAPEPEEALRQRMRAAGSTFTTAREAIGPGGVGPSLFLTPRGAIGTTHDIGMGAHSTYAASIQGRGFRDDNQGEDLRDLGQELGLLRVSIGTRSVQAEAFGGQQVTQAQIQTIQGLMGQLRRLGEQPTFYGDIYQSGTGRGNYSSPFSGEGRDNLDKWVAELTRRGQMEGISPAVQQQRDIRAQAPSGIPDSLRGLLERQAAQGRTPAFQIEGGGLNAIPGIQDLADAGAMWKSAVGAPRASVLDIVGMARPPKDPREGLSPEIEGEFGGTAEERLRGQRAELQRLIIDGFRRQGASVEEAAQAGFAYVRALTDATDVTEALARARRGEALRLERTGIVPTVVPPTTTTPPPTPTPPPDPTAGVTPPVPPTPARRNPRATTVAPGTRPPVQPGFEGIDPDILERYSKSLESTRGGLQGATAAINEMAKAGTLSNNVLEYQNKLLEELEAKSRAAGITPPPAAPPGGGGPPRPPAPPGGPPPPPPPSGPPGGPPNEPPSGGRTPLYWVPGAGGTGRWQDARGNFVASPEGPRQRAPAREAAPIDREGILESLRAQAAVQRTGRAPAENRGLIEAEYARLGALQDKDFKEETNQIRQQVRRLNRQEQARGQLEAERQQFAVQIISSGRLIDPAGAEQRRKEQEEITRKRKEEEREAEKLKQRQEGGGAGSGFRALLGEISGAGPGQFIRQFGASLAGVSVIAGAGYTVAQIFRQAIQAGVEDQIELQRAVRSTTAALGEQSTAAIRAGEAFRLDRSTTGNQQQFLQQVVAQRALRIEYGLTEQQILSLVQVSGQLAKVHGTDLPSATNALSQAVKGGTSSLEQFGIVLEDELGNIRGLGVTYATLEGTLGRARATQILYGIAVGEANKQIQNAAQAQGPLLQQSEATTRALQNATRVWGDLLQLPAAIGLRLFATIVDPKNALDDFNVIIRREIENNPISFALRVTLPTSNIGGAAEAFRDLENRLRNNAPSAPTPEDQKRILARREDAAVLEDQLRATAQLEAGGGGQIAVRAEEQKRNIITDVNGKYGEQLKLIQSIGQEASKAQSVLAALRGPDIFTSRADLNQMGQVQAQLDEQAQIAQEGARTAATVYRDQLVQAITDAERQGNAVRAQAARERLTRYDTRAEGRQAELLAQEGIKAAGRAQSEGQDRLAIIQGQSQLRALAREQELSDLRVEVLGRENEITSIRRQQADLAYEESVASRQNLDLLEQQIRARQRARPANERLDELQFQQQRNQLEARAIRADVRSGVLPPEALQQILEIRRNQRGVNRQLPRAELNALVENREETQIDKQLKREQDARDLILIQIQKQGFALTDQLEPLLRANRIADEKTGIIRNQLALQDEADTKARIAAQELVTQAGILIAQGNIYIRQAQDWAAGIKDGLTDLERAYGIIASLPLPPINKPPEPPAGEPGVLGTTLAPPPEDYRPQPSVSITRPPEDFVQREPAGVRPKEPLDTTEVSPTALGTQRPTQGTVRSVVTDILSALPEDARRRRESAQQGGEDEVVKNLAALLNILPEDVRRRRAERASENVNIGSSVGTGGTAGSGGGTTTQTVTINYTGPVSVRSDEDLETMAIRSAFLVGEALKQASIELPQRPPGQLSGAF